MASITGRPVSHPEPPTLPFSLLLTMNSATALESPLSTVIMNFTSR